MNYITWKTQRMCWQKKYRSANNCSLNIIWMHVARSSMKLADTFGREKVFYFLPQRKKEKKISTLSGQNLLSFSLLILWEPVFLDRPVSISWGHTVHVSFLSFFLKRATNCGIASSLCTLEPICYKGADCWLPPMFTFLRIDHVKHNTAIYFRESFPLPVSESVRAWNMCFSLALIRLSELGASAQQALGLCTGGDKTGAGLKK